MPALRGKLKKRARYGEWNCEPDGLSGQSMNFFWNYFFESAKERRNANVCVCTITVFIAGGVAGCQLIEAFDLLRYLPLFLSGAGLLLAALIWRGFRQMRARRLDRYKSSPLSRDELAKARSKLRKQAT